VRSVFFNDRNGVRSSTTMTDVVFLTGKKFSCSADVSILRCFGSDADYRYNTNIQLTKRTLITSYQVKLRAAAHRGVL